MTLMIIHILFPPSLLSTVRQRVCSLKAHHTQWQVHARLRMGRVRQAANPCPSQPLQRKKRVCSLKVHHTQWQVHTQLRMSRLLQEAHPSPGQPLQRKKRKIS
jgi:hypothetical protein